MKITRIRLSGFKSFVEPTELHVEPGLTGIVGPNGCGKSNLLEALRWTMGESSPKSMRGTGMEDVIFAGTSSRSARSMAEVTVFIDNAERSAPAAYNDTDHIEVSRRIEREAGSAYRINGREVRQRDVQLFFADASTGAHSPALVRQGQIGQLIAAKPLQRRAILEEAAGISGLHTRRHEAELRLKGAEANLARLTDVIGELETQLQALKRQARQATRYRNLSGLIRQAEAMAFHLRWRGAADHVGEAETQAAEADAAASEATQAAAAATTAQTDAHGVLPPLREREAEAAAAFQRLRIEREQLDAEERRARDSAARLERQLAEIDADIARERERAADAGRMIETLDGEIAAIAAQEEGRAAALNEAEALAGTAKETLGSEEHALDEARTEAARLAARRQSLERMLGEATQRLTRALASLDGNAGDQAKAAEDAARSPDAVLAAEAVEQAKADAATARHALAEAEAARAAAQGEAERLREPLTATDRVVSQLRAEEKALTAVLGAGGALWPKLIDALRVQPGYEAALAAALGDDLDVPLDEAAPIHWRALPPLDTAQGFAVTATPLSEFVEAPEALARRLTQIGLIDAAEGNEAQAGLLPGQRLVSREGALWRWDGFRSAAEAETPAAIRLAQKNRLEVLRAEIADADRIAAGARADFHTARESAETAANAERDARQASRSADTTLAATERALAEAEREAIRHSARVTALADAAARFTADKDEAGSVKGEAEAGLAEITGEAELAERIAALRDAVAAARIAASDARAAVDTLKREAESAAARSAAATRDRADWARRAETATAQTDALVTRREASDSELQAVSAIPAEIEEKRGVLLGLIADAETARSEAGEALATAEAEAAATDRALKAANAALADARETRARHTAALENARSRLAETAQRIQETLDCTPDQLLEKAGHDEDDALPALDQIDAKVERLKREREALGGVNLRADEEAQDYQVRLESMTAEKADLESAIAKLRGAIGSLNREGRERLLAAFGTVNAHFKRLFTTLFGGGEAELTLTESDDPLEAGLEILARPPGKKLSTLSLLSGGEQTLTALSLIFAIFLSNPSPICVLDEVDAPLDDANIERFCNLMDEMTRLTETRFLLITHHAYTMARMDRLMGVTMQERGVSQLVSVDLKGAEQVLAAE